MLDILELHSMPCKHAKMYQDFQSIPQDTFTKAFILLVKRLGKSMGQLTCVNLLYLW